MIIIYNSIISLLLYSVNLRIYKEKNIRKVKNYFNAIKAPAISFQLVFIGVSDIITILILKNERGGAADNDLWNDVFSDMFVFSVLFFWRMGR